MRYSTLIVLISCLFIAGCGGNAVDKELSKYTKDNIQKASIIYSVHVALNGYQGPSDMDDLKQFVASNEEAQKRLNGMGIDTSKLDDYMIGRDGQPFEFRWGIKSSPLTAAYPICFEVEGVDGVRQAGISGGKIHEFSSTEEYNDLKNGKYSADSTYSPTTGQ